MEEKETWLSNRISVVSYVFSPTEYKFCLTTFAAVKTSQIATVSVCASTSLKL